MLGGVENKDKHIRLIVIEFLFSFARVEIFLIREITEFHDIILEINCNFDLCVSPYNLL